MVRMIRWTLFAIRFMTPWVVRITIFMGKLVLTTICSQWAGVPIAVDRIAHEWMKQAVAAGFPTEYDTPLYYLFKIIGYAMIIAGWVISSYLTVWLLDVVL